MNQKELIALVAEKTGSKRSSVKKALKVVLDVTKQGLKYHGQVHLGRLGKLKAKKHTEKRYVCKNLKQCPLTIRTKYKKSTIRLHTKLDLSENPQPTIIHKKPKTVPVIRRSFAVVVPRFRGRSNIPRRTR